MQLGDSVVLIFMDKDKTMIPFHVDGFDIASGSRKRIIREYQNAKILFRNGATMKICSVVIDGPLGNSVIGRIFGYLNGSWRVRVNFEEAKMGLDEKKELTRRCLRADQKLPDPFFRLPGGLELAEQKICAAESMEDIFRALNISDESDVLDVL